MGYLPRVKKEVPNKQTCLVEGSTPSAYSMFEGARYHPQAQGKVEQYH
jgi:hypothetical protein